MTLRALGAGVLLVLAFAVGACGSGGGSHSDTTANGTRTNTDPAAEAAVRRAIVRVMTTDDKANCAHRLTHAFVKDAFGSITKCNRNAPNEKPAKTVRIAQLAIDGGTAHAHVGTSGGSDDGE